LKIPTLYNIYKVKKQLNFGQVIRYILVGGISASIEFCVFSILVLYIHIFYLVANVFAFFVAFLIGFWLQKYWTFKNYEKEYVKQMTKSLTVVGIGFLLNNMLVYLFIGVLGLHIFIGKQVELFLVFFWNYSDQRFWTFRYKNEQTI